MFGQSGENLQQRYSEILLFKHIKTTTTTTTKKSCRDVVYRNVLTFALFLGVHRPSEVPLCVQWVGDGAAVGVQWRKLVQCLSDDNTSFEVYVSDA